MGDYNLLCLKNLSGRHLYFKLKDLTIKLKISIILKDL